jgi:hypothetical protein
VPAAIVAFSPGLDYTGTGKSMDTKAGIDPLFTRESLLDTATMYLAGQNPNQPLLSPLSTRTGAASRRSCSRSARARMGARPGALAYPVLVDGLPGVLVTARGRPVTVMAFTVTRGAITAIRVLTDPDRPAQVVPSWVA